MRSIAAVVLALMCLVAPAHAGECKFTEGNFLYKAFSTGMKVFSGDRKAVEAITAKVNEVRAGQSKPPIATDTVLVGVFEKEGQRFAAVLFVQGHCVIDDATLIMPAEYWIQALVSLDIGPDEFEQLQGT